MQFSATRTLLTFGLATLCFGATSQPLTETDALQRISSEGLRGDLSFLASDALEGRGTPSRGLDIAAEFIASRFRAAGLEPSFQTAKFAEITPNLNDVKVTLSRGAGELELSRDDVRVRSLQAVDVAAAPVLILPENGIIPPVEGKIVAGEVRRYGTEVMLSLLQSRHPSLILLFAKSRSRSRATSYLQDTEAGDAPIIRIGNEEALAALTAHDAIKVSVHLSAPSRKDAPVSNVAAILPGSDQVLKNQYIIVSAHYDHLGLKDTTSGDRVYNGANDDGSGTVSVIEIANALAAMPVHPKRSILFLTYFGEEEGLLGSFYYAKHPLVPLQDTIANINLEQMGRTDDTDGKEVGAFGFTGAGFSDLPSILEAAATREGVKVYTKKGADEFFARSDNYALALRGVIAHTICVAFDYPDYHAVGDEWQKIDYDNMAKVDRAVAAGVLQLANTTTVPKWSESAEAAVYREAGK